MSSLPAIRCKLSQRREGQLCHNPPGMSRGLTQAGKQVLLCSCACLKDAEKETLNCNQIRCLSRLNAASTQLEAPGVRAVRCCTFDLEL